MVVIQEFLPNPVGKDAEGEWIKLFNDSAQEIDLTSWQIRDASGKIFIFGQAKIKSGETLTLNYQTTKIQLNNNGEKLFLFDNNNNLVDQLEFADVVNEGEVVKKDGVISADASTDAIQNQTVASIINLPDKSTFNLNFLLIGLLLFLFLSFFVVFIFKKLKITEKK